MLSGDWSSDVCSSDLIDKTYKTIPNKEHRAVAGLSMGGYGALVWAMHHPDTFSYCIALSASMFTNEGLINMPDKLYSFMSLLYGAPNAYDYSGAN